MNLHGVWGEARMLARLLDPRANDLRPGVKFLTKEEDENLQIWFSNKRIKFNMTHLLRLSGCISFGCCLVT